MDPFEHSTSRQRCLVRFTSGEHDVGRALPDIPKGVHDTLLVRKVANREFTVESVAISKLFEQGIERKDMAKHRGPRRRARPAPR